MENWRDIKGYEGFYEVSDMGNVRSKERIIILKDKKGNDRPSLFKSRMLRQAIENKRKHNTKERKYVVLSMNGEKVRRYVHRLVAEMFIDNPLNLPEVNHIDGNPVNNCVSNLEWVSREENIHHAFENKLIKTEKPVAKIDIDSNDIIEIFKSESEACRQVGVTQGKILRSIQRNGTCRGFKWKYI